MSDVELLKRRVMADVGGRRDALVQIADTIHANPEVAFEEVESAAMAQVQQAFQERKGEGAG
ncbi:MAG: hypothetical protein H8E35_13540 [Ardenticatenia bacterium]|nr:hypothetical protein [Ardenticatenia bacterium]